MAREQQIKTLYLRADLPATTVLPLEGGAGRRTYLGDLQDTEHGVTGRVFGVSPDTLLVRDFSFDGAVADTHLWVGGPGQRENSLHEHMLPLNTFHGMSSFPNKI